MSAVMARTSQLKAAWRAAPLSQLCEFKPSKSICRKQLADNAEVSFVPMNDLGELVKYFEPKEVRTFGEVVKSYTYFADGDVLCAKITPCFENGKLGVARGLKNGVGFGSSEFIVMRTNGELLPEFLYYFLSRDAFREAGARVMSGAVGHKRVPNEYFESLTIPLPPLGEQQRIVAVLDQAFAALDRAGTHAEANLTDASELFDASLRVTFAPVAESAPRNLLREITTVIVDCEHKTAPTSSTGHPSIRTPNVGKGVLNLDGVNRVAAEVYRAWTRRAVPEAGDLIMAREAPAGNVAVIPDGEKVCLGQRTLLIKPDRDTTDPAFLAMLLLHPVMQERLLAKSAGATVLHVNMQDIRALQMPDLPQLPEQVELARRISAIRRMGERVAAAALKKLADIADLRQSLLQKAFAGQLS